MNHAAGKLVMLRKEEDFEAFEQILIEAHEREPLPIYGYCLMGNHWHVIAKPSDAEQLSRFFGWLTLTHAVRWRVAHRSVGAGPLYQGRFKVFAVQGGARLLDVLSYVERNPLTEGDVKRAEKWRWSSLWARLHPESKVAGVLSALPVRRPTDWVGRVNRPIEAKELAKLETSEKRERPYGDDEWVAATVKEMGLEHTVRGRGRPRKVVAEAPKKVEAPKRAVSGKKVSGKKVASKVKAVSKKPGRAQRKR
jgi:REP-associated tyrosine transposase